MFISIPVFILCSSILAEEQRCKPCLDSSSSSSSSSWCIEPRSSSSQEICCNTVLMDYDFNIRFPVVGQGWEYLTNGQSFVANDGVLTSKGCAGFELASTPFNIWNPASAQPWTDNYKYFLQTSEPVYVQKGYVVSAEWQASVQTHRTGSSRYPNYAVQKDDVRLASGIFMASDALTMLAFGFLLTNDRIYGLYSRWLNPEAPELGAWTYVIPLQARKSCDINKLRIEFNESCRTVTYMVDNVPIYKITKVGCRLEDGANFLVQEYGGVDADDCGPFPFDLDFGFGTATFLDWYPACKDAHCRNCRFPSTRMALLKLAGPDADQPCNPVEGCPAPAVYYETNSTIPSYHVWGQGVEMQLGGFKVERYACY